MGSIDYTFDLMFHEPKFWLCASGAPKFLGHRTPSSIVVYYMYSTCE